MNSFFKVSFLVLSFSILGFGAVKELNVNACGVVRGAFVKNLAKEFTKRFKIKVNLNKQGGDRDVMKALNAKSADLGFGCRELLNISGEKDFKSEQVAWGILAFLVNKSNKVEGITLEQAKAILKGKITNWKELGGDDAPIHIYLRKPGVLSGVGYSLRKIVFKNLQAKIEKTKYILPNSDYIRVGVYKDPYAFAVGDATSALAFGKVKLLKVNGIKPTKEMLASKKYKAARAYYIYMPQELTPQAKEFVAFALSKKGQEIIKKSFAASLGEGERLLKLLSESTKSENFKTDNKFSMNDLIKQYQGQTLTVYACGITRVAFGKEVMDNFSKKYHIKIKTNKSGGDPFILGKLYDKEADIAVVCRPPFKEGREKNLWNVQVAWGALAFIVNDKNPINNLSTTEVKNIISGKIKNWKSVGGPDAPIHLILRGTDKSGVGSSMRSMLYKDKNYKLNSAFKLVKNSGEARAAVKEDPLAIAADDVTSSQRTKGVKILNIDDIAPTKRAIIEGDYRFRRPFYACMTQAPGKLAKVFINYVLSTAGQKIISLVGTANLAEGKDMDSQNNFVLQKLKLHMHGRTKK